MDTMTLAPGTPAAADSELAGLMAAALRLTRDELLCAHYSMLRAFLAFERSGNTGALVKLAGDALSTCRLRRDHPGDFPYPDGRPARPEDLEDVAGVLARHGLAAGQR